MRSKTTVAKLAKINAERLANNLSPISNIEHEKLKDQIRAEFNELHEQQEARISKLEQASFLTKDL